MPVPDDIAQRAIKLLNAHDWIAKLNDWENKVEEGLHWTPANWYLTDMRYTHNLGSPKFQGYLTDDTPDELYDEIVELGDEIYDWIEDHFEE